MKKLLKHLWGYSVLYFFGSLLILGFLINNSTVWLCIGFIIADILFPRVFDSRIKKLIERNGSASYVVYSCLHRLSLLMILPILTLLYFLILLTTYLIKLKYYSIYSAIFALMFALLSDIIIPYVSWVGINADKIILGSGKIFPKIRKIIGFNGIESVTKLPWYTFYSNTQLKMKSGEVIGLSITESGLSRITKSISKQESTNFHQI